MQTAFAVFIMRVPGGVFGAGVTPLPPGCNSGEVSGTTCRFPVPPAGTGEMVFYPIMPCDPSGDLRQVP